MKTETKLLLQILECGSLDIKYLVDLLEKNNVEIDIEDIVLNF